MEFKIEESDEILITPTGLATIGKLLSLTSLESRLNNVSIPEVPSPNIKHGEVIKSYIGLLAQGKVDFDSIQEFRDNDFFQLALQVDSVPSSPTLRQRMEFAKNKFNQIIREESISLLNTVNPDFTLCTDEHVPLDLDISPFDNSNTDKQGVSPTYKGYEGYAPMFAYFGKEGYCLNSELREGKTHCQDGTKEFLKETLNYAHSLTDKSILVRLDAGNDSKENIKVCLNSDSQTDFIIKRNLRHEDPEDWLDIAKEKGTHTKPRDGKDVYKGSIKREINDDDIEKPVRIVFEVTKKTIDADGQLLLVPKIEVDTYWVSLPHDEDTIIDLYHQHGTCEQFHSELKTDMDLERLPSGQFLVNYLVLLLGMMTYNMLRLMGQMSLKQPDAPARNRVKRRRVRTVIQNLMTIASKLVYHARQYTLKFGSQSPWFKTFKRVYNSFG